MLYQMPQPHAPIGGPSSRETVPIPPVSQPELNAYEMQLQRNRYIVAAPVQLHQGATIQQTIPIPGVSEPVFNYYQPVVNRMQLTGIAGLFQVVRPAWLRYCRPVTSQTTLTRLSVSDSMDARITVKETILTRIKVE
jgi:hypothetical protein